MSASIVWKAVSSTSPCRICGKPDWCQESEDGNLLMCRRAHASGVSGGRAKVDSTGVPYTLFGLRASSSGCSEYESDGVPADAPAPDPIQHKYERAEASVLDAVYSALLAQLKVRLRHEQSLMTRGFSAEEIERLGYRSTPTREQWGSVIGTLRTTYEPPVLMTVPGISAYEKMSSDDKTHYKLRLDGPPSILTPVRDRYGRIVAVQLDTDHENPKYLWLTGHSRNGSKAQLTCHVPLHPEAITYAVRIVGGVYKADLATLRDGVLTLGSPNEYGYAACLADVMAIDPQLVSIAPDADARSNPQVASGLAAGALLFQSHGYTLVVEVWPPELGKGIDDVIVAGHADRIEVLTGVRAWAYIRDVLASSKAVPSRDVEARLTLAHLGDTPEAIAIFRPAVIEAIAALDTTTSEYQSLRKVIVGALDKGQLKALDAAVKRERERLQKIATERRLAELEEQGLRVLRLGDQKELRDVVLDQLTAVGARADHDLIKYVRGKLFMYDHDSGIWKELPAPAIINAVAAYSGSPVGSASGRPLTVSSAFAKGVLDLVRADRDAPTFFDDPMPGIAFANGFLVMDPKTGEVHCERHSRKHKARFAYPFPYPETAARPRRYVALLERMCRDMDPEERLGTIACIVQHLGACLFGVATRFENVIILDGKGGTGNSTLLDIHSGVMPPGSVSAVLPHMMDDPFAVANLDGALLNIADDLPRRELLDAGRLKSIISGKQIEAGPKNVQNYKFRPVAGQLWACNGPPRTHDTTGGLRRRAVILKFEAPIDPAEKNRRLAEEILAEELPQIIACAVRGLALAIKNNRLTIPSASDARVDAWLGDSNPFQRYLREQLVILEGAQREQVATWTTALSVYRHYKAWCEETNHKPMSDSTFGRELKEALGIRPEQWGKKPYHREDGGHYPVVFSEEAHRAGRDREASQPSAQTPEQEAEIQKVLDETAATHTTSFVN